MNLETEMEDALSLPTKRAIVDISSSQGEGLVSVTDSDSSEVLPKKAKTDANFEFFKFTSADDFCLHYCNSPENPYDAWKVYEQGLRNKFKLREIQLFLNSVNRRDEAKNIQSLNDPLARDIEDSGEFRCKKWILRPDPDPFPDTYDEYQRLIVDYMRCADTGELDGEYCRLFCTYASDCAFLELFKKLQSLITWDMSSQDALRLVVEASKEYPDLQPEIVGYASKEMLFWKECEQEKKELVPFFTKLWQEIEKKGGNAVDVLTKIKDNDATLYPSFVRSIDYKLSRNLDPLSLLMKVTLERIKSSIDMLSKEEALTKNDEELIDDFFRREGHKTRMPGTYASYVKMKMKVAVDLGLVTDRHCGEGQPGQDVRNVETEF